VEISVCRRRFVYGTKLEIEITEDVDPASRHQPKRVYGGHMEPIVVTYATYVTISVFLTIWVARTLHKNGRVFLIEVFGGDDGLADSVNHLLVVGFYLINFGYIALALKIGGLITNTQQGIEALSYKIGLVLLVLGGMHFFNLLILQRIHRRPKFFRRTPAADSVVHA
jgi:hypothetical protein